MSATQEQLAGQTQDECQASLSDRYLKVRRQSLTLCSPLEVEDYQIQPMAAASPPKWHLAHVSWFFETFILKQHVPDYQPFHPAYEALFNSYYNGVGQPYPRPDRGLLSRPTLEEIFRYREYVDEQMVAFLLQEQPSSAQALPHAKPHVKSHAKPHAENSAATEPAAGFIVELGINHEQQHQELLLTDLKYNLGHNPLKPPYLELSIPSSPVSAFEWVHFRRGEYDIGNHGDGVFVFDNESPRHRVLLQDFALANRLVTNGEYMEFIESGGYERPELWLSDAWSHLETLNKKRWTLPLYWTRQADGYRHYTLGGEREVDPGQPVCHVSAYEADAYARWRGCRLPTEAEWEVAAAAVPVAGNFVDGGHFHPVSAPSGQGLEQMFGDVWEWTSSNYNAYPGFKAFDGQLGEYNGKFMANQLVLRGGSCATPREHIRATYRNFFYPLDRWQFSGIRLAVDRP